ncbi:glycosyltransferase [Vibrio viridaestus]|uniref:Glycosyltransferase family 2 protein n=1 Tax=Vibrio viridaestus TaxID=2487322 RepID=A0A3N9TCB5_9VIBR|nr:glycosyltransferase [Vibrio viridaestus]RQW61709.1 glycosyltransferase family 2 protein [Vibrio viridaestus]
MALFISVISHNHDDMIVENPTLKNLAHDYTVILKANTPAKQILRNYCEGAGIILLQGNKKKGFGANNNEVFNYAKTQLNMQNSDYFLVLNPDVTVTLESIRSLMTVVQEEQYPISTINLYRDKEMRVYDNSIRRFPSPLNPIKTLLRLKRTDHYDKNSIHKPIAVDWAAGSLLLFNSGVYEELNGFDERYFMYFEDVDICMRGKSRKYHTYYIPKIYAIHKGGFKNRKILSKNFTIYLTSFITFTLKYFH